MIFQNFDLRLKKWLLLFLVLLFSWWLLSASGICWASGTEPTYTITETELTTLENNLATLSSINSKLQLESKKQLEQVAQLQNQVAQLKNQLAQLQEASLTQESSLATANKLLAEYATAEKNKRLRIKAQRNTYFIMMVAATAFAVCHR